MNQVPTGWYEKNTIDEIKIDENIRALRIFHQENFISFVIDINDIRLPITRVAYETIAQYDKYETHSYVEYKYLKDDYSTYRIIQYI